MEVVAFIHGPLCECARLPLVNGVTTGNGRTRSISSVERLASVLDCLVVGRPFATSSRVLSAQTIRLAVSRSSYSRFADTFKEDIGFCNRVCPEVLWQDRRQCNTSLPGSKAGLLGEGVLHGVVIYSFGRDVQARWRTLVRPVLRELQILTGIVSEDHIGGGDRFTV